MRNCMEYEQIKSRQDHRKLRDYHIKEEER